MGYLKVTGYCYKSTNCTSRVDKQVRLLLACCTQSNLVCSYSKNKLVPSDPWHVHDVGMLQYERLHLRSDQSNRHRDLLLTPVENKLPLRLQHLQARARE